MLSERAVVKNWDEAVRWMNERLDGEGGYVLASLPSQYVTGHFTGSEIVWSEQADLSQVTELMAFNERFGLRLIQRSETCEYICSIQDDGDDSELKYLYLCAETITKPDENDENRVWVMDETYLIQGHLQEERQGPFTSLEWQGNRVTLPVSVSKEQAENGFWLKIRRYFEYDQAGLLHTVNWRPVEFIARGECQRYGKDMGGGKE